MIIKQSNALTVSLAKLKTENLKTQISGFQNAYKQMYNKTKYIILIFHYDKQFAAFQLTHYDLRVLFTTSQLQHTCKNFSEKIISYFF